VGRGIHNYYYLHVFKLIFEDKILLPSWNHDIYVRRTYIIRVNPQIKILEVTMALILRDFFYDFPFLSNLFPNLKRDGLNTKTLAHFNNKLNLYKGGLDKIKQTFPDDCLIEYLNRIEFNQLKDELIDSWFYLNDCN
jgi:hypothetical protein